MVILRIVSKFQHILSRHQKFRIIELFILMIISGFMEMLSVSMMIPFTTTIMAPDKVVRNPHVAYVMEMFGIQTDRTFLVFLALLMAMLYLIKNCFLLFQMTVQEKFVQGNLFELQKNLMHSFLSKPYEYFLSARSGEIIRIVSQDTSNAFAMLTTLISLFSELIVSFILSLTIFVISPVLTIVMGLILVMFTLLFYAVSRRNLHRVGERQIAAYAGMNQTLLQSIQGIKEIKLMRKESFFQGMYDRDGTVYVRGRYVSQLLSMIPRFMLEAIAMCSFFVIMAVMIYRGLEFEVLLPAISGIAMAAVRLLPAMNRISFALSQLTYNEPAVDKLLESLVVFREGAGQNGTDVPEADQSAEDRAIVPLKEIISAVDLDYRYPGGKARVLDGAKMEIRRGQSVGIVGASGAGKTTAIDIILGLLKPQRGKVLIDGTDIALDMDGWLSQLAYIPQTIFMLDGSIRENVAFGVSSKEIDDVKVWKALKEAALDKYVRGLPEGLDTQIGERGIRMSGGQRQRIGIARALYTEPEVLFMDEATSALDTETETAIMESIENLQGRITMVIIAHRLTTIRGCDVIYRVQDGKIVKEKEG